MGMLLDSDGIYAMLFGLESERSNAKANAHKHIVWTKAQANTAAESDPWIIRQKKNGIFIYYCRYFIRQ